MQKDTSNNESRRLASDAHGVDEGRQPHEQRRRLIIATVRAKGYISAKEIEENGFPFTSEDASWFERHDLRIIKRVDGFASEGSRFYTYEEREEERPDEKDAIGRLCAAILLGTNRRREPLLEAVFSSLESAAKTRRRKGKGGSNPPGDEEDEATATLRQTARGVKDWLDSYARKRHRTCALDSGTTTASVAKNLSLIATDRAARLQLLTNAPRIERLLEHPDIPIEVIGIGGGLRKDTAARTGYLLDKCLAAWGVQVDVAMVGATSLRRDHNGFPTGFTCDSESEASTKSRILEDAAALRCILLHKEKLCRPGTSAFQFAPASSDAVQVLITDDTMRDNKEVKKCLAGFRQRGIVVLEAETPHSA